MLDFRSDTMTAEQPINGLADLVTRVGADFSIRTDVGVIYSEVHFPVVELAASLSEWVQQPASERSDFEWDSMSTPEPGWIWIRRSDPGWRVGSIHQGRSDMTVRTDEEVSEAVSRFCGLLRTQALDRLGVNLDAWVDLL